TVRLPLARWLPQCAPWPRRARTPGNSPSPEGHDRHMAVTVLCSGGADSAIRRGDDMSDDEFQNLRSAQAGHAVMLFHADVALCRAGPLTVQRRTTARGRRAAGSVGTE